MTFPNLTFIFAFLPILLIFYYGVPKKFKLYVLLAGSILFYGLGSWTQTVILALDVIVNYILSRLFSGKIKNNRIKQFWFWFTIIGNIALLVYFKWVRYIPIGISFYTFMILSYQIDVYRRDVPCEKSLLRLGTYLFFFPKLQEGPITRYDEMSATLRKPVINLQNLESGFQTFVLGLCYKVLLADKMGGLWNQLTVIGYDSISSPLAWLGMAAYTLQLYFDFHGYSLMAMGIGRMLGFSLPRNFQFPYCSKSISEFYRRWHVTLGRWFRDYVYIPLGGSRAGTARTIFNLLFVWCLTGLWHGTGWNFMLWGLSLFFLIALEKLFLKRWLEKFPLIGHLYVLFFIPLTWMLFANPHMQDLIVYFSRLFPFTTAGINVYSRDWLEYGRQYAPYLLSGIVFLLPWPEKFLLNEHKHKVITTLLLAVFFWLCVYSIHNSANNPFLYLQF